MATTGPFNGRSLGIFYNNTLIAYAKSCSLSLKTNMMDITSKDSSLWAANLPSVKDWSITTDGLIVLNSKANVVLLMDALTAGTKFVVKFATHVTGTKVSGDKYWKGQCYVTSIDLNAGMDEPSSFSASIQGTSTLSSVTMT